MNAPPDIPMPRPLAIIDETVPPQIKTCTRWPVVFFVEDPLAGTAGVLTGKSVDSMSTPVVEPKKPGTVPGLTGFVFGLIIRFPLPAVANMPDPV